jgi:hypothetical protein
MKNYELFDTVRIMNSWVNDDDMEVTEVVEATILEMWEDEVFDENDEPAGTELYFQLAIELADGTLGAVVYRYESELVK